MEKQAMDHSAPIRALYDALNRQDAQAFNQFADEKIELVDLGFGKTWSGREAVVKYFKNWWTAFPRGTGEIKRISSFGGDDQFFMEAVGEGRQSGPFEYEQGRLEPTHQELHFNFAKIFRIQQGKIVSIRVYSDAFRVLMMAARSRKAAA